MRRIKVMARMAVLRISLFCILFICNNSVFGEIIAANNSITTLCQEDDNINIPLIGDVNDYYIYAVHPNYPVTCYQCLPDFTDCNQTSSNDYRYTQEDANLYDDGTWVVTAFRGEGFWLPQGMEVIITGQTQSFIDAHYITISHKLSSESSWPQFFVLYADGNMRLIPHPPQGNASICFGASVIIGPARPKRRPYCQINQLQFTPDTKSLTILHQNNEITEIQFQVSREIARLHITTDYPDTSLPFATFRSMFVDTSKCDTALLMVKGEEQTQNSYELLSPFVAIGEEFYFYRNEPSTHNMSAPDIIISLTEPKTLTVTSP